MGTPYVLWGAAVWLQLVGTVIGMRALVLGRVPGRRLQRYVAQPRVWGVGVLMLVACVFSSVFVAVIGVGLIVLGHVRTPARAEVGD